MHDGYRRLGNAVCGLCVIATLVACKGQSASDIAHPHLYRGFGFTAMLRPEVLSSADNPGDGFWLYDFHVGSRPLMFAYAGDQPNVPHFTWNAPQLATNLKSGVRGICKQLRDANKGRASRECVFDLGRQTPRHLHLWYDSLDATLQRTADEAIGSIAAAH